MRCGSQESPSRATDWVERTAISASLVCLVHCAGLPLLLAALPALSKLVPLPAGFHLWVLALALPASGFALVHGFRRHRMLPPLLAGGAGLALLTAGALIGGAPWEVLLTLAGSLGLIAVHIANWRLRHCCGGHG